MTTARELLNQLVSVVADGALDWDKLPVVLHDTRDDRDYTITQLAIEGNVLRLEFEPSSSDDDFYFSFDAGKYLDVRTMNILQRERWTSLPVIASLRFDTLRGARNLGERGLHKIAEMLRDHGHGDAPWIAEFNTWVSMRAKRRARKDT